MLDFSLLNLPLPQTVLEIEELQRIAYSDALTGLLNRRSFDLVMPRVPRGQVLFVDFDHLKLLNTKYGHLVANALLGQVGRVLIDHLKRSQDTAFRFGGDELAVLLPDASIDYAKQLAESIRRCVEHIECPDGSRPCSVSIGIATINGDWAIAFQQANQAMFLAKERGRNQVAIG
ncbi:MAG: GGDEF domain-containing protein [Microcoleus sp.]